VASLPTSNRFAALAEDQLDIVALEEILDSSMDHVATEPLPQRPKRRENRSPETEVVETPRKKPHTITVQADVEPVSSRSFGAQVQLEETFKAPTPRGPLGHPPASTHPTTPTTTPAPTPPTTPAASPSSSTRIRLSVFDPRLRKNWTVPEIRDDEDTLLMADSNGRTLSMFTPDSWRVASYRGGRLEDVARLLSDCPIPPSVKNIIILVGLNDKTTPEQPLVNVITRLKQVLSFQTRRVILCSVPHFHQEPLLEMDKAATVNRLLFDLFGESSLLARLPSAMLLRPAQERDYSHFDANGARELIDFVTQFLHLNQRSNPQ